MVSSPPAIVIAAERNAPTTVRLDLSMRAYGIPGRGFLIVDRSSGRFAIRVDAGPAGFAQGYDGTSAWTADATGESVEQGNADQRAALIDFGRALAGVAANSNASRALRVTFVPRTRLVATLMQRVGADRVVTRFGDYRQIHGLVIPFALQMQGSGGSLEMRVSSVRFTADRSAFRPPPAPRDFTLTGAPQSVPLRFSSGFPIVPVRINGVLLHVILDTGGVNYFTPGAAARFGARLMGDVAVTGSGAGDLGARWTWLSTLSIGPATLRRQPAVIASFGPLASSLQGVDGIIGFEVLARLPVRFDGMRSRLVVGPAARAASGPHIPIAFHLTTPQVDGTLDGIPGSFTIDTGSNGGVNVYDAFGRAHARTLRRGLTGADSSGFGVGGAIRFVRARDASLRLGGILVTHVPTAIAIASAGAETDPTIAANLGELVFRRYSLLLDYPRRRIGLLPLRGGLNP